MYKFQTSTCSVSTIGLTRSFGWDRMEVFTQHDAQELCRLLLDRLETKMKGSEGEHTIAELFRYCSFRFFKSYNLTTQLQWENEVLREVHGSEIRIKQNRNLLRSAVECAKQNGRCNGEEKAI